MAETNGNENTRLDRIEKVLEMFIADHQQMRHEHEFFQQEHSQLLKAQVVQSDQITKNSEQIAELTRHMEIERIARKESTAALDKRVDALVSSIGQLISRIPPSALSPASE